MAKNPSVPRFSFMGDNPSANYVDKNTSVDAISTTSAGLMGLHAKVQYLAQLTQTASAVLPHGGQWQVTSFNNGTLCVSTPSHTLANHLRYMYIPYIRQLKPYKCFSAIKRIQVIVTPLPEPKLVSFPKLVMSDLARSICDELALTLNDKQDT